MKRLRTIIFILFSTVVTFASVTDTIFADTTATATATLQMPGGIVVVTLTNGGSGYSTAPQVTISGLTGCTPPVGTATVSNGVVDSITLSGGTVGCTGTPAVVIGAPGSAYQDPNAITPATSSVYTVLAPIPGFGNPGDPAIDSNFKLGTYVATIFKIGIGLAGLLAVIMIIIGGITYMMSDVIGEKAGGKEMITNAIFGLLLAIGSYAILNTINPNIVQLSFLADSGTTTSGGGSTNTPGQLNESCQNQTISCSSSNCSQYASMINTVVGSDADMKKVLKAFMVEESACDITQTSVMTSSGQAYGLFQFQVPTANANKSGCTTATIDEAWLHNPAHAQESICIAKNYTNYLKNLPSAEGKWRNVFAAYDGGNGALITSTDCPDDISCLNGTNVKRWECPWDDTAHTQQNTGYIEARNAVKKLNYCFENPGF